MIIGKSYSAGLAGKLEILPGVDVADLSLRAAWRHSPFLFRDLSLFS